MLFYHIQLLDMDIFQPPTKVAMLGKIAVSSVLLQMSVPIRL